MLSNNKYATSGLSTITLSYKIAIVATMSAGKSTLLNAILGTDLMPARNEACTAKIFQLDHQQQDGYELYQNNVGWVKTTASDIDQKNKASSDKLIRLRGDIYGLSSSTNPHVQITIYDTPGPNNSMNQSHNDITKNFLQNYDYDMVIYVMNATQFGVNDDRYLLNDLKRIVDTPKKAKIIFALNKADKIDIEKGESIKGLLSEAKKYLKNIGFVNPNVIPISAKATGLARKQKQNMPLTRAERNELTSYIEIIKEEVLFDFINHISSSVEEQYHREIRRIANYQHREENHQNQALEAIIAQSGLLHLEAFLHTAINNSILLKNKTLVVELSHNAFLIETHIKVNSKELPKSNKLHNRMKHCLQHWIDDFFDELSKLYNHPSQIKVDFTGTESDFDDIIASAEIYKQKNKSVCIELNHIKFSEAPDTRLTKFKALIEEAKKGSIDALIGEDFNNEYEKVLDHKVDTLRPNNSRKKEHGKTAQIMLRELKKSYDIVKLFLHKENIKMVSDLQRTEYKLEKSMQDIEILNSKSRAELYKVNDHLNYLISDTIETLRDKDKAFYRVQWIRDFEQKLDTIGHL